MKTYLIALYLGVAGLLATHNPAASAATETVLYSFCSQETEQTCTDGYIPAGNLINVNGLLYGTTTYGGNQQCKTINYGCGVVFSLDPTTGLEKVIYTFCGQQNCEDGSYPGAGLTYADGMLYGTTQGGGTTCKANNPCGTVYAVDPNTGAEKVIYTFCSLQNCADGSFSQAGLIRVKGMLYGTTTGGGTSTQCTNGCGTVFAVNPKSGKETVIYSFCTEKKCLDGAYPVAGLVDVNGTLYGTTETGGVTPNCPYGCGTVFSVDPKTDSESVIYSFCIINNSCPDGYEPLAGLLDVGDILYGTTLLGGAGVGTVFAVNRVTGTESALAFSAGNDGANPYASLVKDSGVLYGTTGYGGTPKCENRGCGTVFEVTLKTGSESVIYPFRSPNTHKDGKYPHSDMVNVDGTLYGTTEKGGTFGHGTIFSLKP